jgi:hypothetical protein
VIEGWPQFPSRAAVPQRRAREGRPSPGSRLAAGVTRGYRRVAGTLARTPSARLLVQLWSILGWLWSTVRAPLAIGYAALAALGATHWGLTSSSGRWFLGGLGLGALATAAAALWLDRRRYRRTRDLIDYLGEDLEVRKAVQLPDEHRVCVLRGKLP